VAFLVIVIALYLADQTEKRNEKQPEHLTGEKNQAATPSNTRNTMATRQRPQSKSDAQPGAGWFQAGYGAIDEEVKRQDQRQKEYADMVRRFWMPVMQKGEKPTNQILFVDGAPFSYREHQFYANGSWRHWATCLIGTGQKCPYDDAGNKNYFVGAYTVIDCNEWKSRDGTTHKNELALYATKGDALKTLKILADRRGGDLSGCLFYVSRTGDKSPATGNLLDFVEKFPTKKIKVPFGGQMVERVVLDSADPKVMKRFGFKKPVLPINYIEKLAPKTREAAERYLSDLNVSSPPESGDSAAEVAY
jgi:hypothetical protein